jgi:hypothetical protein
LILLLAIGLAVNNHRHALLNEINPIVANPSTNPTVGATNFISEAPASPATTSGDSASDLIIRSVEFGLGTHVADVTERVKELLSRQPEGFIINAQSLGTDPKPGRGKVLTIDFDYQGQAHALVIPAGENLSYQTLVENLSPSSNPSITAMTGSDLVNSNGFETTLNSNQRLVLEYFNVKFARFADDRTFEGWSTGDRASLENRMIDTLKGPQSDEYYEAINTLAALHSTNALPQLRKLVFEHRETIVKLEKSNRPRWMAIRALGVIGDKLAVPGMIHLLYHNNSYVRWSAQIALVRLTGQDFGGDWRAWGAWWSGQHRNPPFNPQVVRWWRDQAEPDELAKELAEGDQAFLDNIKGNKSNLHPPDKLIKSLSE